MTGFYMKYNTKLKWVNELSTCKKRYIYLLQTTSLEEEMERVLDNNS